jgi:hypothetical protein
VRNSYPLTIGSLLKQTVYRKGTGEIVYGKTRYSWPKLYDRVSGLAAGSIVVSPGIPTLLDRAARVTLLQGGSATAFGRIVPRQLTHLVESLEKLSPEDIALREIIEGKINHEISEN